MKEYKIQATKKFNLPIEYSVFFLKNRIEHRCCSKCKKIIPVGEVYFCEKVILSYFMEYLGNYHLKCITKKDILKMVEI